jgi:hypothetical protein
MAFCHLILALAQLALPVPMGSACLDSTNRRPRSRFEASLGQQFMRSYLKKSTTKKGLVEWLEALGPKFRPQYQKKQNETVLNTYRCFLF